MSLLITSQAVSPVHLMKLLILLGFALLAQVCCFEFPMILQTLPQVLSSFHLISCFKPILMTPIITQAGSPFQLVKQHIVLSFAPKFQTCCFELTILHQSKPQILLPVHLVM